MPASWGMTWQPGLCVCALGGYCSLFELAAPSVTASDAVPHLRGFPRSCLFAEQQSGFLPNRPRPYLPFPWQQARWTLLQLDHAGTVCGMQPPLTACCVSTREWQRWLLGPACITVVDWLLRWQCKHRHCQGCKVLSAEYCRIGTRLCVSPQEHFCWSNGHNPPSLQQVTHT